MKFAVIPNLSKKMLANILCKALKFYIVLVLNFSCMDEMKREFEHQPVTFYQEIEELMEHCDIVIAIGGDGTIIHASKYASASNKPVLGINVVVSVMLPDWRPMNCVV